MGYVIRTADLQSETFPLKHSFTERNI